MMFASTEDFEARHGLLLDGEVDRVDALLADASALIGSVADGGTAGWVVDGEGVPAAVAAVCIQVAYRAWRNPDSVAREQIGEMSVTYRGGDQPDAIYLTARERRVVRRAAVHGRPPTSIGLTSPDGLVAAGPPDFTWAELHAGHWQNG